MDDGNRTIDFLAMMDPASASPSTRSLQVSPKPHCKNDEAEARKPTLGRKRRSRPLNPNMDPKKLRRIISNRASAYRSKLKQNQRIYDMERKAKALEAKILMLSSQIGFHQKQHEMLLMERESLKQKMSNCASTKYHKEAEIEENKLWLRQLQLILGKQREITQREALYKGNTVSYEHTNNLAQIGKNTREVTSKLSKEEERYTWMLIPMVPKILPTPTLRMGRPLKPQLKANSKSKDPLSLSLGINE